MAVTSLPRPAPGSKGALAILGSGPGGYVAAIRAAQLGFKVTVVERAELGGICANWGCIPTKALLRSGEVLELVRHAEELGLKVEAPKADFERTIARSRAIADRQAKGVEYLFKKNTIEVVRGTGTLVKTPAGVRLAVDGKPLEASRVIVATGARPRPLNLGSQVLEHDGQRVISYREAMSQKRQPKSLVVIGAGAIGVEFAYFYAALGTRVTVVEALPQILPVEDEEVSQTLRKRFVAQGIEVVTGARIERVTFEAGVKVHLKDDKQAARVVEAEQCLLAAGVRGNVEGIGLEAAGIALDRGFIPVDRATYETRVRGVYAIGDVIGPPMLAHKASAEGIACVERMAGHPVHEVDYGSIPGCTYCHPEVASVGLTEAKARAEGRKFRVGRFPFKASGKAMAAGETEGFVKVLIGEPHGEVLGAHVIGGASTDMIATLGLAMRAELTADEILSTVFAHPTFAEAMKEAVADAFGEAIDV